MKSFEKECSVIRRDEREDDYHLYNYELTVRRGCETACFRIPLYSVKVSMTDNLGNVSSKVLSDAFSDAEKALNFYEKAVNHLATPIDLAYVFEDESVG